MRTIAKWTALLVCCSFAAVGDDQPGRGVARISLIQGDVSVRRGDSGEWVAAAPNAPLVVQDRIQTGAGSKAEVQMDYANMVRLASNAEVRLAELEQGRYILQLASGTATFRVLRNSDADVEISTPIVAVRPVKKGMYRITVLPDGAAEITVRSGEADIYTPRGSERLKPGRTMIARGTSADPEFQLVAAVARDEWDGWNERRDQDLERSGSYRYVSSSVYGAEDLDPYGSWVYDSPYGWVWAPRVAAGWAPYRDGRWSWIDWYGWSWVSYDPWGWAPYHYGRWYSGARGWYWWPGAIHARHYWSPGLVGWFGFGGGLSAGFGLGWGHIGWVPLAPYEPYYPWYGWGHYRNWRNPGYAYNNVNIVNNVNVTNIYRNARVRNGITALNTGDFAAGRHGNIVRLGDGDLQRASSIRGQLPLAPERNSLRLTDRELTSTPRSAENARFYGRRSPSPVERVSFEDQRRGAEELSRRTFGDRGTAGGRGPTSSEGVRSETPRSAETEGRGWRRVGEGARETNPRTERLSERTTPAQDGWRRFGEPRGSGDSGRQRDNSRQMETNERRSRESNAGRSPANSQTEDRGGWRRFGQPAPEQPGRMESPRDSGRGRDSSPSQRMDFPRMEPRIDSPRRESPRVDSPRMEMPRRESPRMESPRMEPRGSEGRGGEPVRVNPPIVRERPNQQEFRSFDGGGFGRSPRFESPGPRIESPRFESPRGGFGGGAPRMDGGSRGGFGGGAPRMDGGSRGGFGGGPSSGGSMPRSSGGGHASGGGGHASGGGGPASGGGGRHR